jgi:hypothetical protein
LLLLALVLFQVLGRQGDTPGATTIKPPVPAAAVGQLEITVDVAAHAVLDSWQHPDGGQTPARVLSFTDLAPKTYLLRVWHDEKRTLSRKVTIQVGKTTRIDVSLETNTSKDISDTSEALTSGPATRPPRNKAPRAPTSISAALRV